MRDMYRAYSIGDVEGLYKDRTLPALAFSEKSYSENFFGDRYSEQLPHDF